MKLAANIIEKHLTNWFYYVIIVVPHKGVFFLRPFQREAETFKGLQFFRITGGAVMRVKITLACTECKQRNYNTMKNKKNDPDRLEMNKYCRFCKKHTLHRETK
jgi:large subunit ribosomal protein L33